MEAKLEELDNSQSDESVAGGASPEIPNQTETPSSENETDEEDEEVRPKRK